MKASHRVVYLLGAGFSAPLGIPVMAAFLARAKDLYAERPEQFPHFGEVFERLRAIAYAKNYFVSDQSNIEEVLSILEMDAHVGGSDATAAFGRFITDVVVNHTPKMPYPETWPPPGVAPSARVFGMNSAWHPFGHFVAGLFGAWVQPLPQTSLFQCVSAPVPQPHYDVVTLNYDCILELAAAATDKHPFQQGSGLVFELAETWRKEGKAPLLAKLHGSVDTKSIVPPTWQKARFPEVVPAWRAAHDALQRANAIRVVGYSLPDSDAYVRYLLKSAVISNLNLQQCDVVCLDPDDGVKRRFDAALNFSEYRFANTNTETYLAHLQQAIESGQGLEGGHAQFWSAYSGGSEQRR